mgnify:CR=1 FL=1
MSEISVANAEYASKIKSILRLNFEPVAVKLIPEGENFPNYTKPERQMSHCQAIMNSRKGEYLTLKPDDFSCHVGSSALNMISTPDGVADGTFHFNLGGFETPEAAAKMIDAREVMDKAIIGEIVCPLKDADFEPDVVIIIDKPEKIYWLVPVMTREEGGKATFCMGAFQCTCEDVTSYPYVTQKPNISLGCYGCRRRTDMAPDELAAGFPYGMTEDVVTRLCKLNDGIMQKAKRD